MRLDNPIYKHEFKNMLDIAEYDEVINEYRNTTNVNLFELENFLKNKNLIKFNAELNNIINPTYKNIKNSNAEKKETEKWRGYLNKYFIYYSKFKLKSKKLKNNKIYSDLYNKGTHFLSLNLNEIWNDDIKKKYRLLTSKKSWKPPPGARDRWASLNNNSIENINNIFIKTGIIKACEYYYAKNKMRVSTVWLTVARPSDNSWKQFLYDCKKITKFTNLHIDASEGVVKALIYLNDVNLENGSTSFLPKSNRFIYDPLQSLFSRAIAVGSYCHTPIARRSVFRLPKKLRVTTNFGRLIEDKSNTAKYLDENLVYLTTDKANTILFDPGAGIHNGGIVKKGERIALQVVIE